MSPGKHGHVDVSFGQAVGVTGSVQARKLI